MRVEFTEQQAQFLRQVLDQVSVRGVEAKALVIQLMLKLGNPAVAGSDGSQPAEAPELGAGASQPRRRK